MTTIAVVSENAGTDQAMYLATTGTLRSEGKTLGEAIDAINAQLRTSETGTLVIVQNLKPDRFFTAVQQQRLTTLMAQWRTARDTGETFPVELNAELHTLIDTELQAATQRAAAIHSELAR